MDFIEKHKLNSLQFNILKLFKIKIEPYNSKEAKYLKLMSLIPKRYAMLLHFFQIYVFCRAGK